MARLTNLMRTTESSANDAVVHWADACREQGSLPQPAGKDLFGVRHASGTHFEASSGEVGL